MNKSVSMLIKIVIFGALTGVGIIYVINRSPVESMSSYEKQEMVKPNKTKSVIDHFFSSKSKARKSSDEGNDDVSLTGSSGRYDEVRIGKPSE